MDKFDFDKILDRKNKGFVKWDKYVGKDIIPMWVADMEFKSCNFIIKRLRQKINEGMFGYSYPPKEAYEAVIVYEKRMHDWEIEKEWIIFVPGLVSSIHAIINIFTKRNQNVLTFLPIYPPFIQAPKLFKRKLKGYFLKQNNNSFIVDFDMLKNDLEKKDKLFMLCNPHNPTGKIFSKEELFKISEIAKENNLLVVSDEIHCDLILDKNKKHIPFATVSDFALQNSITMHAPSKTYNIAGLNTAFLIIPNKKLRKKFLNGVGETIPLVNVLGYQALIAAYNNCENWKHQLLEYLVLNRDIVYEFINSTKMLKMIKPDATYLAWIDATKIKNPAKYFEKYGVGLSDGADFGQEGYVRLNFACPRAMLFEALNRIEKALSNLKN